ncbi:hypothetical protein [Vibrio breoganii]|uniref:hypothetical protein n=1 Tax=Vibrio breoganii TaxID=553239 RepID=UPI000C842316|nr:hypothetical protein [Vibrio breoganii]PML14273.1 hypothetical protein BCT84_11515 [Vibrio breoganii]
MRTTGADRVIFERSYRRSKYLLGQSFVFVFVCPYKLRRTLKASIDCLSEAGIRRSEFQCGAREVTCMDKKKKTPQMGLFAYFFDL